MTVTRLGRYEIEATLREEPLGRVLRGRLPELNRGVWIGELCPPPALPTEPRERLLRGFEEECRRLVEVGDPRVQRPCDLARTDDGVPFVVFDRAEALGYEPLPERRELPPEEWVRIAVATCEILQALLDAGISVPALHPANLFRAENGTLRYVPLQFGKGPARRLDTAHSTIASPELLARGQTSPAGLVYAVAAWLYGQLAGLPAHELAARALAGEQPEPVWSHNAAVRAPVSDALETALRNRPEERYPTPRALAAALLAGEIQAVSPAPAAPTAGPPEPRDPVLLVGWWITGAALITLAGVLFGWVLAQVRQIP